MRLFFPGRPRPRETAAYVVMDPAARASDDRRAHALNRDWEPPKSSDSEDEVAAAVSAPGATAAIARQEDARNGRIRFGLGDGGDDSHDDSNDGGDGDFGSLLLALARINRTAAKTLADLYTVTSGVAKLANRRRRRRVARWAWARVQRRARLAGLLLFLRVALPWAMLTLASSGAVYVAMHRHHDRRLLAKARVSWEPVREASSAEPGADHLSRKVANGGGSERAATAARPSPVAGANHGAATLPFLAAHFRVWDLDEDSRGAVAALGAGSGARSGNPQSALRARGGGGGVDGGSARDGASPAVASVAASSGDALLRSGDAVVAPVDCSALPPPWACADWLGLWDGSSLLPDSLPAVLRPRSAWLPRVKSPRLAGCLALRYAAVEIEKRACVALRFIDGVEWIDAFAAFDERTRANEVRMAAEASAEAATAAVAAADDAAADDAAKAALAASNTTARNHVAHSGRFNLLSRTLATTRRWRAAVVSWCHRDRLLWWLVGGVRRLASLGCTLAAVLALALPLAALCAMGGAAGVDLARTVGKFVKEVMERRKKLLKLDLDEYLEISGHAAEWLDA